MVRCLAFMCPEKVPGIPQEFKTDINSAQNLPPAFYHFAFNCNSLPELDAKREELLNKGVDVTPVVDHAVGWPLAGRPSTCSQKFMCGSTSPNPGGGGSRNDGHSCGGGTTGCVDPT